jgi:L-methionine (R)-S-oxide reductase
LKTKKAEKYIRIQSQLKELLTATEDTQARMATVCAVLHHKFKEFFWTGFYKIVDGELTVACYQGPLACQVLKKDTGVCWAAVHRNKTLVVENVHEFPGHIACDSRSNSEIVVPLRDSSDNIIAVLDIDSESLSTFDQIDARHLERILNLIL